MSITPPEERFFAKVEKNTESGCWEWIGAKIRGGYGKFFLRKEPKPCGARKTVLTPAHRWSYEYHVGPIAEGMELDHLCRNKRCVNPDHLEQVTHVENCRRVPRAPACPRGHAFTESNTVHMVDKAGYRNRYCRECRKRFYGSRRRSGGNHGA